MSLLIELALILVVVLAILTVGGVILLAFTTGFHNTGRKQGGVYFIFAPPGEGKSYLGTETAIEAMRRGRRVFSNFPIIIKTAQGILCSRLWKKEYRKENLTGAVIIMDEAQVDFWARNFGEITEKDLAWFTEMGQYEVSLYIITQHVDNIEICLRRVVNLWLEVRKTEVPFLGIPIFFTVSHFVTLDDYLAYRRGQCDPYFVERLWFNKDIASAYDTKWFAHDDRPIFEGISWLDHYAKQNPPVIWVPPTDISLYTRMDNALEKLLNTNMSEQITMAKRRISSFMSDVGGRFDKNTEKNEELTQNKVDESLYEQSEENQGDQDGNTNKET